MMFDLYGLRNRQRDYFMLVAIFFKQFYYIMADKELEFDKYRDKQRQDFLNQDNELLYEWITSI